MAMIGASKRSFGVFYNKNIEKNCTGHSDDIEKCNSSKISAVKVKEEEEKVKVKNVDSYQLSNARCKERKIVAS